MSIEQSRRDDLESLFYILIYTIKGRLPWQGLVVYDDETRMRKIAEIKGSITPEKLTEGLSIHLTTFFKYVKKLKFQETPDYKYLTQLLYEAGEEKNTRLDDHEFEWVSSKSSNPRPQSRSTAGLAVSGIDQLNKKKPEDMQTDGNPDGTLQDKKKLNTVNYLEIPNGLNATGKDSDNNTATLDDKGGFNSRAVKVSSASNITSKEELGIIKDLEIQVANHIMGLKSGSENSKKANNINRRLNEDDSLSENYSQDVMDEKVSNIAKKIEKTTLSHR